MGLSLGVISIGIILPLEARNKLLDCTAVLPGTKWHDIQSWSQVTLEQVKLHVSHWRQIKNHINTPLKGAAVKRPGLVGLLIQLGVDTGLFLHTARFIGGQ